MYRVVYHVFLNQGWLEKPLLLARAPYDKAVFFDADVLIEHHDVAHLFAWLEAERHDFMAVPHRTHPAPALHQALQRPCTCFARASHALSIRSARAPHALCTRSARALHPLCTRSSRPFASSAGG